MPDYDDILRECSKDEAAYHRLRALVETLTEQRDTAIRQHEQDIRQQHHLEDLLLSQNGYMLAAQRIALDLLNRRDLSDLLRTIVDDATAILDAPYGEIMLREGDRLVVQAFTPNQPMLAGDRVGRDEAPISWHAVDTGQPVVLDDYQTWPKRRVIYSSLELHAIADFPIIVGDECVGVLALARSQPDYPFSPEHVQKGIWFAQMAALALDITLLYDAAQREIAERKQTENALRESEAAARLFQHDLKTLHEVNLELSSLETLDDLCQRTIELARERLGIDRIGLFLTDADHNELIGTFGVDTQGMVRNERYYRELIRQDHWTKQIDEAPNRVIFWTNVPHFDNGQVVGEGWRVAAGLWNGHEVIGYLVTDNLLTQRPARPYETELLSLLGATVGHLVTIRRANDALRQSEARMRHLLHNGHVMFTHTKMNPDRTWRRLFVSENAAWLSGYTLEQLADWDFWTAQVHPDDLLPFRTYVAANAEAHHRSYEYRFRFADGRYHWLQSDTIRLPDPPDGLPEFLSTGIDITERKEAQDALRRSEERLRFLLMNAPVMIFSCQVMADSRWGMTFVSENATQILDYPLEHYTLPNFWSEVMHPDDVPSLLRIMMSDESRLAGEFRIRRLDGEYRWLYGEAQRTNPPGAPLEYVGYAIDITERKLLEAALLEEERLRGALAKEHELSDLKSRMMVRISHEFRTPLSIILTSSEILERYYDRISPEKRYEQTKKIRQGVFRITHILDEINRIMHRDGDASDLLYDMVDLEWLISSVIANLRLEADNRRMITTHVEPAGLQFYTDPDILRSILGNLLSNAIKFSQETQPIMLSAVGSDDQIVFSVSDRGIGIPADEIAHVTQAFYRAGNIGEVEGIGLGLTVVEDAVARLNGTLKIESTLGEGTTVTVTLPAMPPHSGRTP